MNTATNNARIPQIIAAMSGRQASAVSDTSLRDGIAIKLDTLSNIAGRPIVQSMLRSYAEAVCRAAAHTIIFEDEVYIAMEMGAAGEFDVPSTITKDHVSAWITAYASSNERRLAQEQVSIAPARARRADAARKSDELRRDFEVNGLRRAWQTFIQEGWAFREGYGSVLYDRIGVEAIRATLTPAQITEAKGRAIDGVRRDYPQKFRSATSSEVEQADVFKMHFKAQLCRAYFQELRARGLTVNQTPAEL